MPALENVREHCEYTDLTPPGSVDISVSRLIYAVSNMRQRLLFLRFMSGELSSMFSSPEGRRCNADGHMWHHETMGRELREAFDKAWADDTDSLIQVSLSWSHHKAMRLFFDKVGDVRKRSNLKLIGNNIIPLACQDLEIFRLLDALRSSEETIAIVADEYVRPVADAIGAELVPAPPANAYTEIDSITEATAAIGPDIVLSAIGIPSGCLLDRMWRSGENPSPRVALDVGHMFDALLGKSRRRYLRRGVPDWLPGLPARQAHRKAHRRRGMKFAEYMAGRFELWRDGGSVWQDEP